MIGKRFFQASTIALTMVATVSPALAIQGAGINIAHDATVTTKINGAVTQAAIGDGNKMTQQISGAFGEVTVGHDLTVTTKINGAVTSIAMGNKNCMAQQIGALSSNAGC